MKFTGGKRKPSPPPSRKDAGHPAYKAPPHVNHWPTSETPHDVDDGADGTGTGSGVSTSSGTGSSGSSDGT